MKTLIVADSGKPSHKERCTLLYTPKAFGADAVFLNIFLTYLEFFQSLFSGISLCASPWAR